MSYLPADAAEEEVQKYASDAWEHSTVLDICFGGIMVSVSLTLDLLELKNAITFCRRSYFTFKGFLSWNVGNVLTELGKKFELHILPTCFTGVVSTFVKWHRSHVSQAKLSPGAKEQGGNIGRQTSTKQQRTFRYQVESKTSGMF